MMNLSIHVWRWAAIAIGGVTLAAGIAAPEAQTSRSAAAAQHYLYVASPGIRNYVEYGGLGVIVYDMAKGHTLVRRFATFDVVANQPPENVKGIAASAATNRLYVSTIKRVGAFDLVTGARIWIREYAGGADRLAISPDGRTIYLPTLEGPHWKAIDAATGDIIKEVVIGDGAHNTVYGGDGKRVYLASLRSRSLAIADPATHTVVGSVGPFSNSIRPFTINGKQTLCFVNVNDLLGFEVGDITSGKMLHRVEVSGYEKGPVKRHACPSHGVALTPDERELWLADGPNSKVHIFDATVMPPKQVATIGLRDQPGWITFSLDGRYGYPSTGEVIDVKSRKIVATLSDESGAAVQSEKVVEVVLAAGKAVDTGDQFGVGRVR